MKKLVSVLLCLLLVCAMSPAMALEMADVTGTWYLTQAIIGGAAVSPESVGMDVSIELRGDSGAVLYSNGNATPAVWKVDGSKVRVVDPAGGVIELTYTAGSLTMDLNGSLMTFGREPARHERPTSVNAEQAADFYGTWEGSFVFTDTTFMYLTDIGLEMVLRIDENGIAQLENGEAVSTWSAEVKNGWLVGSDEFDMPMLLLCLNTDGTITLANPEGSLCFVRAAE